METSATDRIAAPQIPVWGGMECTVARIGDGYRDLLREMGHFGRTGDAALLAEVGIKAFRLPLLWEHSAPQSLDELRWERIDVLIRELEEHGIDVIAGLLHHGSGPRYTNLLDPQFPAKFARYAAAAVMRYSHIPMYTPVNEPLTTARFSCLYGHWYPHHRGTAEFLRALFHQVQGTSLAMKAIRSVNPNAKLMQTEDLGRIFAVPELQHQADYENERRWLSLDLLCGRVTPAHGWYTDFVKAGVAETALDEMASTPCPPNLIGINYYLTSDRFLDSDLRSYPSGFHGGNGQHSYADVEAVRVECAGWGLRSRLDEVWGRYHLPIVVSEVHNGCVPEEQICWANEIYRIAQGAIGDGIDLRAICIWALFGSLDWDTLLTRRNNHFEGGAFESVAGQYRLTALGQAVQTLARGCQVTPLTASRSGWWHRDERLFRRAKLSPNMTPQQTACGDRSATGDCSALR